MTASTVASGPKFNRYNVHSYGRIAKGSQTDLLYLFNGTTREMDEMYCSPNGSSHTPPICCALGYNFPFGANHCPFCISFVFQSWSNGLITLRICKSSPFARASCAGPASADWPSAIPFCSATRPVFAPFCGAAPAVPCAVSFPRRANTKTNPPPCPIRACRKTKKRYVRRWSFIPRHTLIPYTSPVMTLFVYSTCQGHRRVHQRCRGFGITPGQLQLN
jgi:hypothetical protein